MKLGKRMGQCDVDSGQILMCDPCYIKGENFTRVEKPLSGGGTYETYPDDLPGDFHYEGIGKLTCNAPGYGQLHHEIGHAGAGVVMHTMYGDGTYDVWKILSDAGEYVGVFIDFNGAIPQHAKEGDPFTLLPEYYKGIHDEEIQRAFDILNKVFETEVSWRFTNINTWEDMFRYHIAKWERDMDFAQMMRKKFEEDKVKADAKMQCVGCKKHPKEIQEYIDGADQYDDMTPEDYVRKEEGTYNRENGHFYCTKCYLEAGQPLGKAA